MKKGLVILTIAGLALLAFLYFSPVTPQPEEPVAQTEEQHNHEHEVSTDQTPDEEVDQLLQQMQTGEIPPMQAVLKIRDIAEAHPENVKANITLGQMSMQTAQFEKAIGRFKVVVEQQPDNPLGYRLLAEAYLRHGDTTSAKGSFAKALQLADDETAQRWKAELKELK